MTRLSNLGDADRSEMAKAFKKTKTATVIVDRLSWGGAIDVGGGSRFKFVLINVVLHSPAQVIVFTESNDGR